MTRNQRRLVKYLEHIVEAIERINQYVSTLDEKSFLENFLVKDAVIRNFEIIGEASKNILNQHHDFAIAHPELPLLNAYKMRNVIAHGYFQIDYWIVWTTIHNSLPFFLEQLLKIQSEIIRTETDSKS